MQVTKDGLTSEEAARRLEEYGPNKLAESTRNPFLVYLGCVQIHAQLFVQRRILHHSDLSIMSFVPNPVRSGE